LAPRECPAAHGTASSTLERFAANRAPNWIVCTSRPKRPCAETDDLVDTLEGRKTAIREKARETKSEATEMMKIYLSGDEDALDGFEFLSMAEAGELCRSEIVAQIAEIASETGAKQLADWAVPVQREHVETVRRSALTLAAEEAKEMIAG
jgi:hypothetical protein